MEILKHCENHKNMIKIWTEKCLWKNGVLFNAGLLQTFTFCKKKKEIKEMQYLQSTVK